MDLNVLKQELKDIADTYKLQGKSQAQIYATGTYKREILAEGVFKLYSLCEKSVDLMERKCKNYEDDGNLINRIKDAICEAVPNMITEALAKETKENEALIYKFHGR